MHLRLASWVTTIAALICTPLLVVPGTAHADHVSLLDATEPVVISASPARLAAASDATSAAFSQTYIPPRLRAAQSEAAATDVSGFANLTSTARDSILAQVPFLGTDTPRARLVGAVGDQGFVLDAYKRASGEVIFDLSHVALGSSNGAFTKVHDVTSTSAQDPLTGVITSTAIRDGVVVDSITLNAAAPSCGLLGSDPVCGLGVSGIGIILAAACVPQAPVCGALGLGFAVLSPFVCVLANLCPLYQFNTTTMECLFNGCKVGAQSVSAASFPRTATANFFFMRADGTESGIFSPMSRSGGAAPTFLWAASAYSNAADICTAVAVQIWYTVIWNDESYIIHMDPKTYPKPRTLC